MMPDKPRRTAMTKTGKKQTGEKAKQPPLTDQQRYRMIQETAYYIAEKAGFKGDNVKYWLAAEKEINKKFS